MPNRFETYGNRDEQAIRKALAELKPAKPTNGHKPIEPRLKAGLEFMNQYGEVHSRNDGSLYVDVHFNALDVSDHHPALTHFASLRGELQNCGSSYYFRQHERGWKMVPESASMEIHEFIERCNHCGITVKADILHAISPATVLNGVEVISSQSQHTPTF